VEQFANDAQTTLNGAINNSVTSVTVTSATGFPTIGNFRVVVESEIMLVTSVSGNVFTVVRGQEGTTAAAHADLADIAQVVTKGSMAAFRSDSVVWDTYANRPAAGYAGRLHLVTDDVTGAYDDGSVWRPFGIVHKFTAPVNANYAWVNQGSATVSTSQDGILLSAPTNSGDGLRIRKKAAPATPYTITAFMAFNTYPQNYNSVGLCFRESSSGKLHTFGVTYSGNLYLGSTKWNSETSFGSDYANQPAVPTGIMRGAGWIRIGDDGTNRKCWYSSDGKTWLQYHTISRTDFMTANEVGFFMNINNTTYPGTLTLLSWKEA